MAVQNYLNIFIIKNIYFYYKIIIQKYLNVQ